MQPRWHRQQMRSCTWSLDSVLQSPQVTGPGPPGGGSGETVRGGPGTELGVPSGSTCGNLVNSCRRRSELPEGLFPVVRGGRPLFPWWRTGQTDKKIVPRGRAVGCLGAGPAWHVAREPGDGLARPWSVRLTVSSVQHIGWTCVSLMKRPPDCSFSPLAPRRAATLLLTAFPVPRSPSRDPLSTARSTARLCFVTLHPFLPALGHNATLLREVTGRTPWRGGWQAWPCPGLRLGTGLQPLSGGRQGPGVVGFAGSLYIG